MTSRQLRLLRGAAASSVATVLAAVSHTVGGGASPHPLLVLALSVFLMPLTTLVVGRRPRLWKLATAVVLAQGAFHLLFHVLGGAVSSTGVAMGHQHQVNVLGTVAGVSAPDAPMIAAHIVAAILTTTLLRRGEQLLRAIAGWVRAAILLPAPSLPGTMVRRIRMLGETARIIAGEIRTGDVTRRGPPALSRG